MKDRKWQEHYKEELFKSSEKKCMSYRHSYKKGENDSKSSAIGPSHTTKRERAQIATLQNFKKKNGRGIKKEKH